jgi:hypothetical protein
MHFGSTIQFRPLLIFLLDLWASPAVQWLFLELSVASERRSSSTLVPPTASLIRSLLKTTVSLYGQPLPQ